MTSCVVYISYGKKGIRVHVWPFFYLHDLADDFQDLVDDFQDLEDDLPDLADEFQNLTDDLTDDLHDLADDFQLTICRQDPRTPQGFFLH